MICRRCLTCLYALLLMAGSLPAWGMEGDYTAGVGVRGVSDFSLQLSREDIALDYGTTTYRTTIRKMGVDWVETLAPRIAGVLSAGYLELDQTGNPALAGQTPNGYYGGLGLRAQLLRSRGFVTTLGVHYRYHRVNTHSGNANQDVTLRWEDIGADLAATLHPTPQLSLTGGVSYGQVSGRQEQQGTLALTRHFDQDRRLGYFAILGLQVERGGAIRLAVQGGQYRGAWLSFSHAY